MLLRFFTHLRDHRVPVSVRELLDLHAAMNARLVTLDLRQFYFLARLCLVKDERFFDRFDVAFSSFFDQLDSWEHLFEADVLHEALKDIQRDTPVWQRSVDQLLAEYRRWRDGAGDPFRRARSAGEGEAGDGSEERADALREEARERSEGQRHQDQEGRSGEGEQGEGEEGEEGEEGQGEEGEEGQGEEGECGEGESGKEGEGEDGESGLGAGVEPGAGERDRDTATPRRSATAVWALREFQDYDPDVELGTRNMKLALRRLRRFVREAADFELDLPTTIRRTAQSGGILDIVEQRERHNAIKVLLFLDVGGSMDEHIEQCERLFSAARSEFKYLEFFYFHNFLYESVWLDNERRQEDRTRLNEVLARYAADARVVIVGDASMGRHEISETGGSVEHYNAEPGEVWLERLRERFRRAVWLNPVAEQRWQDFESIRLVQRLMDGKMYHLGEAGLAAAMKSLAR